MHSHTHSLTHCALRGGLGILLHGLRHLADCSRARRRGEPCDRDGEGQEDGVQAVMRRWPAQSRDGLVNFRELLWYWEEYYHRRGRDRLSLEFSTHIRFEEWQRLVGE